MNESTTFWYVGVVMGIPNVKRYRITGPEGETATLMAVLPKDADVSAYVAEASSRFDWKALKRPGWPI
ncbi:MAG: hypothetical protein WKF37_00900 [Bryobacteraceae bacterium]